MQLPFLVWVETWVETSDELTVARMTRQVLEALEVKLKGVKWWKMKIEVKSWCSNELTVARMAR
jgi:hypothetical protein